MITGFPSPAQGYEDNGIDLNSLLVAHPAATVFMRIESSAYTRMGIFSGDIILIDRALEIKKDQLVVFENEGEFNLGKTSLIKSDSIICGTVTFVIHKLRNSGMAVRSFSTAKAKNDSSL